jgi:hypothetical protein
MKFRVTMKDPDTLGDAVYEAVKDDVMKVEGLSQGERVAVIEERQHEVRKLCEQWFEYDEYLCVEIDTEAETCTVVAFKAA